MSIKNNDATAIGICRFNTADDNFMEILVKIDQVRDVQHLCDVPSARTGALETSCRYHCVDYSCSRMSVTAVQPVAKLFEAIDILGKEVMEVVLHDNWASWPQRVDISTLVHQKGTAEVSDQIRISFASRKG